MMLFCFSKKDQHIVYIYVWTTHTCVYTYAHTHLFSRFYFCCSSIKCPHFYHPGCSPNYVPSLCVSGGTYLFRFYHKIMPSITSLVLYTLFLTALSLIALAYLMIIFFEWPQTFSQVKLLAYLKKYKFLLNPSHPVLDQ